MRRLRVWIGRAALACVMAALLVSGMGRIVVASLATVDRAPADASLEPRAGTTEEMELLLRDVGRRDADLARREAAIALREQDLRIAREEVGRALDDLAAAEAALEARMFASDSASEADLERLTLIYEGMKPKDAALLFEAMAPTFAAGFLARMAPDVASAVFSELSPNTAYALSAMIAGRNAGAATQPAQADEEAIQ